MDVRKMSTEVKNPCIFTIAGGFFFFGDLIESPQEGYVAAKSVAMSGGGIKGDRGIPGVARGDPQATITLDRFAPDSVLLWPKEACYCIAPSINLYEFKGTTIRG